MRPLVIDDETKKKVQAVVEFARQKAAWHSIDMNQFSTKVIPGEDPRHCCDLDTYHCVFSYSFKRERLYRHLSVSVPGGNYPNIVAVLYIAQLFGYTGWDQKTPHMPIGWMCGIDHEHKCIVIMQRVREEDIK